MDFELKFLSVECVFICIDIDINIPRIDSGNMMKNLISKFRGMR